MLSLATGTGRARCRIVRTRWPDASHQPRIVYCVTENDIGQIAVAMKAGASDYMMKPFDRDILEAKFLPEPKELAATA